MKTEIFWGTVHINRYKEYDIVPFRYLTEERVEGGISVHPVWQIISLENFSLSHVNRIVWIVIILESVI